MSENENEIREDFEVVTSKLFEIKTKLDKLVRKAKKLSIPALEYTVGEEILKRVPIDYDPIEEKAIYGYISFTKITLHGSYPKLEGWTFASTIQHQDCGNILRKCPGVEVDLPVEFRTCKPKCDHCNTIRRRNDTYVVHNEETEEWLQIGSSCIKDFLGGRDPHDMLAGMEIFRLAAESLAGMYDGEFGEGGGYIPTAWDTQHYLTIVAFLIRKEGWVSRSKCYEGQIPTADAAIDLLTPRKQGTGAEARRIATLRKISDNDASRAKKALEWFNESIASKSTLTDYEWNVKTVIGMEQVTHRETGILASVVASYLRNLEELYKVKTNEYFGNVKDRIELTLEVQSVKTVEGYYGETFIHKMSDADGRCFVWFASNDKCEAEKGDKLSAKWTIKDHKEYKGLKQTVLTRPSKLTIEKSEEREAEEAVKDS